MSAWAALLCAVALAGCNARLFETPLSVRDDATFARRVPPELRSSEGTLFFATDREASVLGGYGTGRGLALKLGAARVRFGPEGLPWTELAKRTIDGRTVGLSIVEMDEFGVLSTTAPPGDGGQSESGEEMFAAAVNEALAQGGEPTITVFVHGFNSSFSWGIFKAASLWHYGGRRGVVITYSWPAHAHPFAYARDRETGWITSRALREFLSMLAERTEAERINVLTYSAGAPVVVDALHQMRLMHAGEDSEAIAERTRLSQVVLAGPDLAFEELQAALLDGLHEVCERLTIYTSRVDTGLWLSTFFYFGSPRLGWGDRGLTEEQRSGLQALEGVSVIDVSGAQRRAGRGDFWAHAYWYGNPWVSSDLIRLLRTGDAPGERGLRCARAGEVWRFPAAYGERFNAELAKARAGANDGDERGGGDVQP